MYYMRNIRNTSQSLAQSVSVFVEFHTRIKVKEKDISIQQNDNIKHNVPSLRFSESESIRNLSSLKINTPRRSSLIAT